jgi:hypothetical protein
MVTDLDLGCHESMDPPDAAPLVVARRIRTGRHGRPRGRLTLPARPWCGATILRAQDPGWDYGDEGLTDCLEKNTGSRDQQETSTVLGSCAHSQYCPRINEKTHPLFSGPSGCRLLRVRPGVSLEPGWFSLSSKLLAPCSRRWVAFWEIWLSRDMATLSKFFFKTCDLG